MCAGGELSSIMGGLSSGEGLQSIGGIMQSAGKAQEAFGMRTAFGNQANEILAGAKRDIGQTALAQERARGRLKAGYAKAGVKMTGTAKRVAEEQYRQDEEDLAIMKYNAELGIKAATQKQAKAGKAGVSSAMKGLTTIAGMF